MYDAHLFIKYTRRIGKIQDENSAGGCVRHKRPCSQQSGFEPNAVKTLECF